MASPVRTLLKKKKLTGEELGRILLIDLADTQAGRPNLSQEEIASLHTYINKPEDGRIFNDYTDIQRYLIALNLDHQTETKRLLIVYLELYRYWQKLTDAEKAYETLSNQPRILTRRDYERLLAEARARVEGYSYSFMDLMLQEAETYTPKYEAGEITPYDAVFKQLKGQPIPAHMVEKYQVLYKDDNSLEEHDKLDYLQHWIYVYDPAETDNPNSPLELKADFPEFTQAVLTRFSKLKGLKHLGKMKEADYTKEDLIKFKTAYDLDILDARKLYDNPTLTLENGRDLSYGVAVIEDANAVFKPNIKDGTYYYKMEHGLSLYLSENFLKDDKLISVVEETKRQLKHTLKKINGFGYAIKQVIKITGVKELEIFNISKNNNTLKLLNTIFEDIEFYIHRYGLLENERPEAELCQEVKALFMPDFTEEDVAIQPHEIEKVEEIIANSKSKGEAVRLVGNYLTELKP